MRFSLNGSQVTRISNILARWHAKVNSFFMAWFHERCRQSEEQDCYGALPACGVRLSP